MKEKNKKQNGITLIALIISIIVLLILAMVSIKLIWDGGLITHAQISTSKYTIEQEKELIGLGYSDYKIARVNNNAATLTVKSAQVNGIGPWTITFYETGNRYTLKENGQIDGPTPKTEDEKILEKYFLGENGEGIDVLSIVDGDTMSFIGNDIIPEANSQMTFLNTVSDNNTLYIYVKYNNVAYKVVTELNSNDINVTKSVSLCYTPTGLEGQTKIYNGQKWTILYDNGETVEMVSNTTMGSLTLGEEDAEAQGNNAFEKAVYSYNNAVARLNKYCRDLIGTTDKNIKSVRSVGSNPNNPTNDDTKMYISERLASLDFVYNNNNLQIPVEVNGLGKGTDINYEQDIIRMSYWRVTKSSDEECYWLASREVTGWAEEEVDLSFCMRKMESDTQVDSEELWSAIYYGTNAPHVGSRGKNNHAVRPVIKISSSELESN